jgi:hypothetical protein
MEEDESLDLDLQTYHEEGDGEFSTGADGFNGIVNDTNDSGAYHNHRGPNAQLLNESTADFNKQLR